MKHTPVGLFCIIIIVLTGGNWAAYRNTQKIINTVVAGSVVTTGVLGAHVTKECRTPNV